MPLLARQDSTRREARLYHNYAQMSNCVKSPASLDRAARGPIFSNGPRLAMVSASLANIGITFGRTPMRPSNLYSLTYSILGLEHVSCSPQ